MASQRITPGRLAYLAYYRPLAALRQCRRQGGPWQQWLDRRGRRAMRVAAAQLPPLPAPAEGAPEVYFLTGRRFWFQTAFCFWSLGRVAGTSLRGVFVDDGTLDDVLEAECRRLFPGCLVQRAGAVAARLDRELPADRFPILRTRRAEYPNLRKLTDVHAGESGWRLVLDSDMLFFRRPDWLLAWLAAPDRPLHMTDVQDSYGYPRSLLERLAGQPVPVRLNVGLCGLRSDEIDWHRLESWCHQLQDEAGTSYYQEQAIVAMMLAGRNCRIAPAEDYRLMPSEAEAGRPTAVMYHYVDLSKRGYFRHAWRQTLRTGQP